MFDRFAIRFSVRLFGLSTQFPAKWVQIAFCQPLPEIPTVAPRPGINPNPFVFRQNPRRFCQPAGLGFLLIDPPAVLCSAQLCPALLCSALPCKMIIWMCNPRPIQLPPPIQHPLPIRGADRRNAPKGAQRARRLADARGKSNTARNKHPSLWRRADSSTST